MQEANHKCYMCRHFDRYYTKGIKHFNKATCGWCTDKREIVGIHENCIHYIPRPRNKRVSTLLRISLSELLTEITEVRKMLEVERDETDENTDM